MGGALAELNRLDRARGQFAATLAMEGLLKKRERAREHQAKQVGRAIPTSGPGRRRAKAIRNRDAVTAMTVAWQSLASSAPDLLAEVLAWCSNHPAAGPLPESGTLTFYRDEDGTVSIRDEAPDVLAFSADLLRLASPAYLTFADGTLTMHVQPEPLHYRPLGPDPASLAVVFERIRET